MYYGKTIICIIILSIAIFTGCISKDYIMGNDTDKRIIKIETSGSLPEGKILEGEISGTPQSGFIKKTIKMKVPDSVEFQVKPSGDGFEAHFPENGFEIELVKFKVYLDGKEIDHIYQCNGDEVFLQFNAPKKSE